MSMLILTNWSYGIRYHAQGPELESCIILDAGERADGRRAGLARYPMPGYNVG